MSIFLIRVLSVFHPWLIPVSSVPGQLDRVDSFQQRVDVGRLEDRGPSLARTGWGIPDGGDGDFSGRSHWCAFLGATARTQPVSSFTPRLSYWDGVTQLPASVECVDKAVVAPPPRNGE
jgi:hypothetical protein